MSARELITNKLIAVNAILKDIDLKGLGLKKRNYLCGVQIIQRGNAFDDVDGSMIYEVAAILDDESTAIAAVGATDSMTDDCQTVEEVIKAIITFFHSSVVKNYYSERKANK